MSGEQERERAGQIKKKKERKGRDAERLVAKRETEKDGEAVREERVGVNKMSSVIRPLVLKVFVEISYFRGSN